MKTYTVAFSYTVYGTALHIEANTPEEAKEWLFDELDQIGIDEFEYETNNREYNTENAKEVK